MAGSKEPKLTMLIALVLGLSVLALAVAWGLRGFVLRQDNGTPEMRKISDAIQEGAQAFLRRQYRTIGLLSIALGVLIYVLYAFFRKPRSGDAGAHDDPVLPVRRVLLRGGRSRGHVRRRALQHPDRQRGALQPQQGAADRAAGRRRERAVRGGDESVRRGPALQRARRPALRADQDPPHDRGLRLRGVVRGAVRAAGRRHLHQGRGRRR